MIFVTLPIAFLFLPIEPIVDCFSADFFLSVVINQNLDRMTLFYSNLRSNINYQPGKMACFAMEFPGHSLEISIEKSKE